MLRRLSDLQRKQRAAIYLARHIDECSLRLGNGRAAKRPHCGRSGSVCLNLKSDVRAGLDDRLQCAPNPGHLRELWLGDFG